MAKPKHKEVKFSAREMVEDLPGELDFSKLKLVGRGKEAIFKKREAGTSVTLDPDVAEIFADSKTVNDALRGLIGIAKQAAGRRRRTA